MLGGGLAPLELLYLAPLQQSLTLMSVSVLYALTVEALLCVRRVVLFASIC